MIYAIVKAKNGNLQLKIGCDIQGLYMVIITICYQSLYIKFNIDNILKMVDNKSKDESGTVESSSNGATHVFDTVRENLVRAVDQMASVQPQYSQAISNLQLDYIQAAKNMIQNTISAQKQLVGNFNVPVSTPYTEQFTRQTNEITNNTLRGVGINNQLAFNAVDLARENLKIYNRTVYTVTEFGTNIAKVCTAFSAAALLNNSNNSCPSSKN